MTLYKGVVCINSLEDYDSNTSSGIVLFIFSNRIFMTIERMATMQKVESVT